MIGCLLIVLVGLEKSHPILVAANRDEDRSRKASPPGLFVGERQRMISPRDRRAGGTWLAVNEAGCFAGITNLTSAQGSSGAISRGRLPHLALDQEDLESARAAVAAAVRAQAFAPFQLVLSDGRRLWVLIFSDGVLEVVEIEGGSVVISNEHGPGELHLRGLSAARARGLDARGRLVALQPFLLDDGAASGHEILDRGPVFGTVSSSLIAVPRSDPRELIWLYANGRPDLVPYRDYGNLGRRLVPR